MTPVDALLLEMFIHIVTEWLWDGREVGTRFFDTEKFGRLIEEGRLREAAEELRRGREEVKKAEERIKAATVGAAKAIGGFEEDVAREKDKISKAELDISKAEEEISKVEDVKEAGDEVTYGEEVQDMPLIFTSFRFFDEDPDEIEGPEEPNDGPSRGIGM